MVYYCFANIIVCVPVVVVIPQKLEMVNGWARFTMVNNGL